MHFKVYLLLFFVRFSDAFNITTILNQHPSFSTLNRYISQTQLADEINSRRFVTVFAVPNDVLSSLSWKPNDVVKDLLRVHVVLGYYDVEKLRNLPTGSVEMTTLFQTTGRAVEKQGFLKATVLKSTGEVVIRSATQTWGAILVRSVAADACKISVVSISKVIVPMGMDCGVLSSNSNLTCPVEPPGPSPAHSPKMGPLPTNSPKAVPSVAPKSPFPSANAPGDSPLAGAPMTESPANAPRASRESPPKHIDKQTESPPNPPAQPPTPPANSGGSKTSDDWGQLLVMGARWLATTVPILGLSVVLLQLM